MIYIKNCEVCDKSFETSSKWKRSCSNICAKQLRKIGVKRNKSQKGSGEQICVKCQRATGKCLGGIVCPWARDLTPVSGWDADKIVLKEKNYTPYESYNIIFCPLYLEDIPKRVQKNMMERN